MAVLALPAACNNVKAKMLLPVIHVEPYNGLISCVQESFEHSNSLAAVVFLRGWVERWGRTPAGIHTCLLR